MTSKTQKLQTVLKRIMLKPTPALRLIIFTLLFIPITTNAQKQELHQTQLWYAYFNNLKFSDKYRLLTDVQERQFIKPVGAQGTFLFRSILYRNLGNGWEAGIGVARFYQSPTKIPTTSTLVVPEWRPTVDLVNKQKTG